MAKKVNIKELSRRYTTAVFDLAKSQNKLEAVAKDLERLKEILKNQPRLQKIMSAKTLGGADQVSLVKELGNGFDALTVNFLLIVARNGRLKYLANIVEAFIERIAGENGELKAQITTAAKLDEKQLAAITKDLSAKSGKKIVIEEIIRPEIIGGLIVKIGPKMFDYSVKSRLTRLKNKLKEAS